MLGIFIWFVFSLSSKNNIEIITWCINLFYYFLYVQMYITSWSLCYIGSLEERVAVHSANKTANIERDVFSITDKVHTII
jgi:hypothetical protein